MLIYKMEVTSFAPVIIVILFIVVIILGLLIAYKSDSQDYESSRIKIFISVVTGLGIFLSFVWFFSALSLQANQHNLNVSENILDVNSKLWDDLLLAMQKAAGNIPIFFASLYPLENFPNDHKESNNTENGLLKIFISRKIFSIWQKMIELKQFVKDEGLNHLTVFVQWCSSPLLLEQWNNQKINFDEKTVRMGDLLFTESQNNMDISKEGFIRLSQKISKDEKYLKLMK